MELDDSLYLSSSIMKVYSISKWAFRGICLLILILPVSRHWRLLTTGEKAAGTVIHYTLTAKEDIAGNKKLFYASEIQFDADRERHLAYGPMNYEYTPGRKVIVFYDRKDPSSYCISTFTGFYLNNYIVLPIILLTVWIAFYLSFNNYQRKQRFKKKLWQKEAQNKAPRNPEPLRRIR